MTFDPNADISGGKVRRRGRTAGIAAGGVGVGAIALLLLGQLLGVDLTGLVGGGDQTQQIGTGDQLAECTSGADANASIDCRMKGAAASLEQYWAAEVPRLGGRYASPEFILFTDQTSTGCGTASSATGPFYCPADGTIYVDTGFYDELRTRFGSSGGPLAEVVIGADGDAGIGVVEVTVPAGAAMPEHAHGDSAVLLIPQQGRLRLVDADDGAVTDIEPGALATIPVGQRVTLENSGDADARTLVVLAPAGFAEAVAAWPVAS